MDERLSGLWLKNLATEAFQVEREDGTSNVVEIFLGQMARRGHIDLPYSK